MPHVDQEPAERVGDEREGATLQPLAVLPVGPAPMSLIHGALEKGVTDPTVLEKLLSLQERYEDRVAQQAFNRAMNAVQKELGPIKKDAKNGGSGKNYASLDGVLEAITPVYLKHGFSVCFTAEPTAPAGIVRLRADVSHNEGHTRSYYGDYPLDNQGSGKSQKSDIQATGSAISYGKRYLLGMIWNLQFTERPDLDGRRPADVQREQQPQPAKTASLAEINHIRRVIQECNEAGHPAEESKICSHYRIRKLEEFPAAKVPDLLENLGRRKRGEV